MPSISLTDLQTWRHQAQTAAEQFNLDPTEAAQELDWLLREQAGVDRLTLRLATTAPSTPNPSISLACSLQTLDSLWQRRLQERLPLQYLLGHTPWRQFELQVSPAVLIPRPETELIIDIAQQAAQDHSLTQGHWADLGTGSGAIALGLAAALPQVQIHAVDRSTEAIALAQTNAQRYPCGSRIRFYQGDWLSPLTALRGQLSGLVSNPPYIPAAEIQTLQPEVRDHEPHLALDGGPDGLNAIRHLIQTGADFLQPGGLWLIEHMAGQGATIQALLATQGNYEGIWGIPDWAGHDRFVGAFRKKRSESNNS